MSIGNQSFDFGAGQSLLISADIPTISQITHATLSNPYFSLIFDLDPVVLEALILEMNITSAHHNELPIRVDTTETEVADTALRLMQLLERPASLPILKSQLIREMHYWLLAGCHGAAIRNLGVRGHRMQQISKVVSLLRSDYAKPLRIELLADIAGMSLSSFHEHFRAVTSLTPLQFQKQLRLIEARRLMLSEGMIISRAGYMVGYESVSQFTREYGRMFGKPPAKDIKGIMNKLGL